MRRVQSNRPKNLTTMKEQNEELADTFKRFDHAAKHVPNTGYITAYQETEARGRKIMDETAARKGERDFPPARQVVKP